MFSESKGGEKMKKEYLYGIIGLLGGIVLAVLFASNAVNSNNQQMMGMMGMQAKNEMMEEKVESKDDLMHGENMTMEQMTESLEGKTGDDFDQAFILSMIEHHQGAIDMAKLALDQAGHQEIKDLAEGIISAQENEIELMKQWQSDWEY